MNKPGPIPQPPNVAATARQRLQGQRQQNGMPVKAFRGELRSTRITFDGAAPWRMAADNARCYLMVQNNSAANVRIAFGTQASNTNGFVLTPTSAYELPVAPVNEVSIFGPAGSFVDIVIGSDAGL